MPLSKEEFDKLRELSPRKRNGYRIWRRRTLGPDIWRHSEDLSVINPDAVWIRDFKREQVERTVICL